MKRYFILTILIIFGINSYSQITKKVSVTGWHRTDDNKLAVEYYVVGGTENEVYELTIKFYDNKKIQLPAFAISGDFPKITGGAFKKIYWDVLKDRQDFPDISEVKINVKSAEVKKVTTPKSTAQKPVVDNKNTTAQKPPNNTSNTKSTSTVQKTDNTKPVENVNVNTQNISKEKRKFFTIGAYAGYGYGLTKEFDAGANKKYDQSSGVEMCYGGYLAISHFSVDISKTERQLMFVKDKNNPKADVSSINASLDFYSDIPASPKHKIGILLGFGVGSYTTQYTDEQGIESILRENEIAYYPKAGIIIPLGKHLKFSLIDTYHLSITPMNDFFAILSLNI